MNDRRARLWVVALATAITMGVTASLGMWQLDRARQKTQLQDSIDAMAERTPLTARELAALGEPSSALHRRVSLSGHWVSDATLFLDNRQMLGRTGFFVVTPLRLQDQEQVILVQRGWVPRDFQDRARVPLVPTPPGTVRVEGRLALPPGKLFEFAEARDGPIRQNINLAALAEELSLALMPLSVVQTDDTSDGLLRNWPVADTGVHKHHGYAFQWFGLCALAGFLFVWFQIISPRRRQRPHVSDT